MWKEVDGLVVILLVSSGSFFELNKIGSEIWRMVAQEKELDKIADNLLKTYDVSRAKLLSDIQAFAKKMISDGMLIEQPLEATAYRKSA